VLLSPVFATRSHPGARGLGALRFATAAPCPVPVVALGAWMRAGPAAALAALGRH
jgi:thiamine-phosphate pyrophosphorylase